MNSTNTTEKSDANKRLVGIDAARGLALIGMFLVHFLPTFNNESMNPTITGLLFSGRSAALFVVLAGVGLAIIAHRQHRTASSLTKKIIIRAVVIAVIGILLGSLGTPVNVILVNYGLLFIIALPFLSASPRTLLIIAFSWLTVGSIAYWMIMNFTDLAYPLLRSPDMADVIQPHIILADAFVGGYYPILTWGFYLFIGLWLGRVLMLSADKKKLAQRLISTGAITTGLTLIINYLVIVFSNLIQNLDENIAHMGSSEIVQRLNVGMTEKELLTEPLWFFLTTPHSNSPVSLLHGAGTAFLVIGLFLLIAHWRKGALSFLTTLGTMPLSLYAWHIILFYFITHPNGNVEIIGGMITLIAGAVLVLMFGSGKRKAPLEALTTSLSNSVSKKNRNPNE